MPSYGRRMQQIGASPLPDTTGYRVTLRDRTTETVFGSDAFCHERVMTTFYRTANTRGAVDCWATPLASFRTDEILMVRRLDGIDGSPMTAGSDLLAEAS